MTFTPDGAGFPVLSTITVRVTNGMDTVSGNAMFAPYELKFRTATNNFVAAAPFIITNVVITNGVDVQVSCLTAVNRTYQLQSRDSLDATSPWTNLGSVVTGTGGVIVFFVSGGGTAAMRFYRVAQQ